jgi:signal transduction histidine kinase
VFERFTRLGDHLTRTVGGAGLGLFIARRLVEGMGGTIAVGAGPTGGASFSFTLPAAARAPYPTIAP